ncbi:MULTISPECIES: hypothetical protein [Chryseobacterium]|uniref:Uncharacterized protein n=1 Tax=Chryseobacterium taihuense TaxID=1141221 RepID=A0A1G9PLX7_9FLAO|nr:MULTISPECIES: hypothetical protein [Chryseobacterium]MXS71667.1 hypothetical protein [Flavobacteriaceae bacterium W22]QQV03809.1 hypothetical protein I6I61_05590 [Chryseobacterium sp. FDAARGOS 1104]SDL99227.1 hypothetical protein SAMN05216273_11045 [Chryseobacterium taihuense]VFB02848.1 Uncharacterised protein [Chryseobacterium taihuense]
MKKIILLAAFGVAGLVSAKSNEKKETKNAKVKTIFVESKCNKKQHILKYYNPIRLESSCGYVEFITLTPEDHPSCLLVELAHMEEFCYASVDGEWLV